MPYRWDAAMPNRGAHFIRAVGRLAPGQPVEAGRAELVTIAARLEREYPRDNTDQSVAVLPLKDAIVENARPVLLLLGGAVAFVLLVACANLANLLLAQGAARRSELAVRAALGADRSRLIRQLLTESLTLAVAGAAAGLALAYASMPWLTRLSGAGVPGAADIRLDNTVLLFTTVVTLATGIVIGLLPALPVVTRRRARGRARGRTRSGAAAVAALGARAPHRVANRARAGAAHRRRADAAEPVAVAAGRHRVCRRPGADVRHGRADGDV